MNLRGLFMFYSYILKIFIVSACILIISGCAPKISSCKGITPLNIPEIGVPEFSGNPLENQKNLTKVIKKLKAKIITLQTYYGKILNSKN